MSLLLSRYCTLLLPELQASEDSHDAFILRTWSSMSVLSIRFQYYMSAHEGPVVTRKVRFPATSSRWPPSEDELSEITVYEEPPILCSSASKLGVWDTAVHMIEPHRLLASSVIFPGQLVRRFFAKWSKEIRAKRRTS